RRRGIDDRIHADRARGRRGGVVLEVDGADRERLRHGGGAIDVGGDDGARPDVRADRVLRQVCRSGHALERGRGDIHAHFSVDDAGLYVQGIAFAHGGRRRGRGDVDRDRRRRAVVVDGEDRRLRGDVRRRDRRRGGGGDGGRGDGERGGELSARHGHAGRHRRDASVRRRQRDDSAARQRGRGEGDGAGRRRAAVDGRRRERERRHTQVSGHRADRRLGRRQRIGIAIPGAER